PPPLSLPSLFSLPSPLSSVPSPRSSLSRPSSSSRPRLQRPRLSSAPRRTDAGHPARPAEPQPRAPSKSSLSEFDDLVGHPGFDKQGTRFKRLIKDQNNHKDLEEGINRLVLCSGKFQVYYELDEERRKTERTDVAICRVEQLCPFPYDLIQWTLKGGRADWLIEKCIELGASSVTPVLTEQCHTIAENRVDRL
ncbi:2-oxoglutarate dehydrogenase E1 component, partial [Zea mays]